jgi:hypothetical protein
MDPSLLARDRPRRNNAVQNPGLPDMPGKRRTKAEKAEDDKRLKESEATKKKDSEKAVERLAMMEIEAEERLAVSEANRPGPVRPRPRPYRRKVLDTGGQKGLGDDHVSGVNVASVL